MRQPEDCRREVGTDVNQINVFFTIYLFLSVIEVER